MQSANIWYPITLQFEWQRKLLFSLSWSASTFKIPMLLYKDTNKWWTDGHENELIHVGLLPVTLGEEKLMFIGWISRALIYP